MPELPEVEHARRVAERVAANARIARARCAKDDLVFPDGPDRVRRALVGRRVEAVRRRGKWIWLVLDGGPHPLVHLGMTGSVRARDAPALALRTGPRVDEAEWPPRFTKLHLELERDDGSRAELVITNTRRLGRVILRDDPENEPPLSELGFDPLLDLPSDARFRALLAARRGTLKGVLLDQRFAAGVGNWVADEVLYQAGLDPRRAVSSLTAREVRRLRAALARVVCVAVDVDADAARYPRSWLFHHRWEKGTRTHRGDAVEHVSIAGRTTAWVPARQR